MVLGNVRDLVALKLHTHQILFYPRTSLVQPSTLISLADHKWLLKALKVHALSPSVCHPLGSAILRKADQMGQIDLSRIVGRGLYRTEKGKFLWHVGDRILMDGRELDLGEHEENIFLPGPRIEVGEISSTDKERQAVAIALTGYRWLQLEDAKRFIGWLVASAVGGALEWRPHVWMVAPSESGKSWILKSVASKILGNLACYLSDATPAAISRKMRSDSLPVILDEAEPDSQNIKGILSLVRIAAGGEGERIRADQANDVQSLSPRFSMLLSSTKIAQLRTADSSRMEIVNLSASGVADWPKVRKAIETSLKGDMGSKIRSSIIRSGPEIVQEIDRIADEMTLEGVGSRSAMIAAALSAGWRWMSGTAETLYPERRERSGIDAGDALREIVGIRVRTSKAQDSPLIDLLRDNEEIKLTSSHGVKKDEHGLYIATENPTLKRTISRTPWANVDIKSLLLQINGVAPSPNPLHFGGFKSRALFIPLEVCREHGIDLEREDPYAL